ncbi:rhodanese-like domain-containing protein [Streptococcus chenjunshii]|uniref:Rhodanese-like domain-containing protein n=1 Tax=Streptococcus chenjunshii TaxID=2173853 RepID=A0A372KME4_9STRE|nr:rhodanese-like domain-containing protein [Streptococcus chenjunshii]AXQ78157.1 rhodanese-like domain-containing protein [Streptococcus chenjunshii]RFU50698.1 rhodanese-like domain-containing protein [Streptococcus chenjunshii]RFU53470.1 rhodanese-like domain-containing protein [Streptococcus chenjunshii]
MHLFKKTSSASITAADLEKLLKSQKITLLDVRSPQEYQSGHIVKARNWPLERIADYQGSKDQPIYLICQSGGRSQRAAGILSKKGYKAVNIRGGMASWQGRITGGK